MTIAAKRANKVQIMCVYLKKILLDARVQRVDHGGRRRPGWVRGGGAIRMLGNTIARGTGGLLSSASQKLGADEHR